MRHHFLWLLVPAAAWLGYRSSAAKTDPAGSATETSRAREIAAGLEHASTTELAAEAAKLRGPAPDSPDGQLERNTRSRLLCIRWAELDPEGAWARLQGEEDHALRAQLTAEWALRNPSAAFAALDTWEGRENGALDLIGKELITRDPEIFAAYFARYRMPHPDGGSAWLMAVEKNPARFEEIAKALLAEGRNSHPGASAIYGMLGKLRAQKDAAGTLEWAMTLEPEASKAAVGEALEKMAEAHPAAAWKALNSEDPRFQSLFPVGENEMVSAAILRLVGKDDPAAAFKLIKENSTGDLYDLFVAEPLDGLLIGAIQAGKMDVMDAYRLAGESGIGNHGYAMMNSSFWGKLPTAKLEETAQALAVEAGSDRRSVILGALLNEWKERDESAAIAFASTLPDPALRAEVYGRCFTTPEGSVADSDYFAATLHKIPAQDRAAALLDALDYADLVRNPDATHGPPMRPEALAVDLSELPPSEAAKKAVVSNSSRWGASDPLSALAWADAQKDSETKAAGYAGAVNGWALHDPYAAAEWLAAKPADRARDAGTLYLVKRMAVSDAEGAWEWTSSMSDPTWRLEARSEAMKAWLAEDPEAARAAFNKLSPTLPKAERSKLAESISLK